MISLGQLWLPILLSAAGVFIASSVLHMMLKFWHQADYKGFANEDAIRAAMREQAPKPGMYTLPHCQPGDMGNPEVLEKFNEGPVGMVFLQGKGMPSLGKMLVQWFVFCVVTSLFAAYVGVVALAPSAAAIEVFRLVGTVAFMAYAFGSIPLGIWYGQPWIAVFRDVVDGLVYGAITAAIFAWLWPQAMAG